MIQNLRTRLMQKLISGDFLVYLPFASEVLV